MIMNALRLALLVGAAARSAAANGATPLGEHLPLAITTIDARLVKPGVYEFDKNIASTSSTAGVLDDDAHFLKDLTVTAKKGVNCFRGMAVADLGAAIDEVAAKRGAKHCILYVHGFTNAPGVVFDAVKEMNEYYAGKGVFVIPVVWPAEAINYRGQKGDAPGAAKALRSLVPGVMTAKTPISIVCHSMGNYVLKHFAPDDRANVRFKFKQMIMVASDVRSTLFDADGKTGPETGDGDDIRSICAQTVHVLWHYWDMALLGRRALNRGEVALGKVGDKGKRGKIQAGVEFRKSNDFGKQIQGWVNWRTGHGYHTVPGALDYYLANL